MASGCGLPHIYIYMSLTSRHVLYMPSVTFDWILPLREGRVLQIVVLNRIYGSP